MKTFEQIREEFGLILEKRVNGTIPLELAKKQYSFFLQELAEKIKQEVTDRNLSLEDYEIDGSTTFQNFDSKLEFLIDFIERRLLSEMGTITQ